MIFQKLDIKGAYLVSHEVHGDNRGHFSRLFCGQQFEDHGIEFKIAQINRSSTQVAGSIRGLHFQRPPFAEKKIVQCTKGRVIDVIADLRANSPTFRKWQAVELKEGDHSSIYIPKGCAHGFQTIEPNSEMLYFHSIAYSPDHDDGVRFDEPLLNISWPLPVSDISLKDRDRPYLEKNYKGLTISA